MKPQAVDTTNQDDFKRLNMWRLKSLESCVRPGLRRIYTPDSGKTLVGGFSYTSEFTGETWHYVFDVASTGTRNLRVQILTEDFETWQILTLNSDMVPRAITAAVVIGQIVIGGPDMPTLWGLVGGPLRIATKVASDNPATTALDIGPGIVCSWVNRVVRAEGNSYFVSDPIAQTGGDARTYTAENAGALPGVIYGLHEGAGGMLVAVTSAGTYGLDASAAAVGIVGSNGTDWRMLNHHVATSYASSCTVRGRVYALSNDGWVPVDEESLDEVHLTDFYQSRAYGTRISLDDYRTARMYGTGDGPIVAADVVNSMHALDIVHKIASWWTNLVTPTNFHVRGVLQAGDGEEMLLCENGIFRIIGNFDGEIALTSGVATQPTGVVLGTIPGSPMDSRSVEFLHTAADVGGAGSIKCALQGSPKSGTPLAAPEGITIGTDAWGTTAKRYVSTPMRGARFRWSPSTCSNTRDITIEVGADGCGARLHDVIVVQYSESAVDRPETVIG